MIKISTNWLNDYIDISEENLKDLALKITDAGVNIEKVEQFFDEKLVVGQIKEVENHPNSDHLHICFVDVGEDVNLKIVCGAPNVEKNMKVIVSKVGCVLPDGTEIKESKIRGENSSGMLCALMELGLEENTEENYAKGIYRLPDSALVGANPYIYLGLDDTLYTLDLNPNRVADCTNHIGFSYEVGAVINKKVEMPDIKHSEEKESVNSSLELDVISDACPLYLAKKVIDVEVKESPRFIKERLEAAGIRSINNVVDISNYVMLEYGQPLHFFDADKIDKKIIVRNAWKDEKCTTLDNENRILSEDDIVITSNSEIIAVAGVMGCTNSSIDETTKNIVIESAIFNPLSIRYTSKRLGIKTEASTRFEYGLNYEYTYEAIERACYLLEKYANAKVLGDIVKYDVLEKTEKFAEVHIDEINKLLDLDMSIGDAINSLNRLNFTFEEKNGLFTVKIPNRRQDVSIKEDLIEEIGRLYGYDKIKSIMPNLPIKEGGYKGNIGLRKKISKRLRSLGLNETKTYTLISEEENNLITYKQQKEIRLLKPMSKDKSIIRQSLIPSLINVARYNFAHGIKNVNIYEIANTYYDEDKEETKLAVLVSGSYISSAWQGINLNADFYCLKGIITNLLDYLGYQSRVNFVKNEEIENMHPGATASINIDNTEIGFIGKVSPMVIKEDIFVCELSLNKLFDKKVRDYRFKEINKFPSISKDLSLVMDESTLSSDVEREIKRSGGKLLVSVNPFDVYKDKNLENKKSITYKLIFEDYTKTLTSEEVNALFNKIIDEVTKKLNIKLRD